MLCIPIGNLQFCSLSWVRVQGSHSTILVHAALMLLSRVELSRKYCSRNGQGNPCCGLLHRSCVPSHSCYCGARLGLPGMLSSLHKGKSEAYKDFAEGCEVLMGLDLSGRRETTEEVNHQSWNSLRKPSSLVPSTRQMCLVVTAMTWCSLECELQSRLHFKPALPLQICDLDFRFNLSPVPGPCLLSSCMVCGMCCCYHLCSCLATSLSSCLGLPQGKRACPWFCLAKALSLI